MHPVLAPIIEHLRFMASNKERVTDALRKANAPADTVSAFERVNSVDAHRLADTLTWLSKRDVDLPPRESTFDALLRECEDRKAHNSIAIRKIAMEWLENHPVRELYALACEGEYRVKAGALCHIHPDGWATWALPNGVELSVFVVEGRVATTTDCTVMLTPPATISEPELRESQFSRESIANFLYRFRSFIQGKS